MKRTLLLSLALFTLLAPGGTPPADAGAESRPATWDDAAPLRFARPTKLCEGVRKGAWVRLHCAKEVFVYGFRLAAGSAEGVTLEADRRNADALATFPVRPGDRRLFVIERVGPRSGYTISVEAYAVISEVWMDGEDEPTITVD